MARDEVGGLVEPGMRIAFRQQAQQGADEIDALQRLRARHDGAGAQPDRLDREIAELFLEPGAPDGLDAIALLQHRLHLLRAATPNQP